MTNNAYANRQLFTYHEKEYSAGKLAGENCRQYVQTREDMVWYVAAAQGNMSESYTQGFSDGIQTGFNR